MMKAIKNKKGFTLIELAFALTFISVLLITIGFLTIHITSTYEKGLTIKSINASGKEIIDDMSRSIGTSPAQNAKSLCGSVYNPTTKATAYNNCVADNARKLMYQQSYNKVYIKQREKDSSSVMIGNLPHKTESVPVNGAICTGRYSYIWNTGYALNTQDYKRAGTGNYTASFVYGSNTINNFRFLKVSDYTREVCLNNMNPNTYSYDSVGVYRSAQSSLETNEDLLESTTESMYGQADLALYDFTLYTPSIHSVTDSGFYSASFILATLRGNININATGEFCSDPPENLDTDFAYCAINRFNFSMRAAGEKLNGERW